MISIKSIIPASKLLRLIKNYAKKNLQDKENIKTFPAKMELTCLKILMLPFLCTFDLFMMK